MINSVLESNMPCSICKQNGHNKRSCKDAVSVATVSKCSICKQEGHNKRSCKNVVSVKTVSVDSESVSLGSVEPVSVDSEPVSVGSEPVSVDSETVSKCSVETVSKCSVETVSKCSTCKPDNKNLPININSVNAFFEKSSREGNDNANKSREELLSHILSMTFSEEDPGRVLQNELKLALENVALEPYTEVKLIRKGGRIYNYDFDAIYTGAETFQKKIEFKYGCSSIDKLTQFLSLSVKQFLPEFIPFWWERLDAYVACDVGITHPKPSLEEYLRIVNGIDYSVSPFLQQMKDREHVSKIEKHKIVNNCIRDFLQTIQTLPLEYLQRRFSEQQDKYYFLWNNNKMAVDRFKEQDVTNIQFHSVTKNSILLKSDSATFKLLLRWRNHKGILNPAWQISMKRNKI
jgi:hypothetical protein